MYMKFNYFKNVYSWSLSKLRFSCNVFLFFQLELIFLVWILPPKCLDFPYFVATEASEPWILWGIEFEKKKKGFRKLWICHLFWFEIESMHNKSFDHCYLLNHQDLHTFKGQLPQRKVAAQREFMLENYVLCECFVISRLELIDTNRLHSVPISIAITFTPPSVDLLRFSGDGSRNRFRL